MDAAYAAVSTHSRPKAAGKRRKHRKLWIMFQLTAARRRLAFIHEHKRLPYSVSTHSRPKAAGASAETLNRQGLHCPVSLRFH